MKESGDVKGNKIDIHIQESIFVGTGTKKRNLHTEEKATLES